MQTLLAYLVTSSTVTHQRETLMALLWPDLPPASAQTNLRQIVYQLRKTIPTVASHDRATIESPFCSANSKRWGSTLSPGTSSTQSRSTCWQRSSTGMNMPRSPVARDVATDWKKPSPSTADRSWPTSIWRTTTSSRTGLTVAEVRIAARRPAPWRRWPRATCAAATMFRPSTSPAANWKWTTWTSVPTGS